MAEGEKEAGSEGARGMMTKFCTRRMACFVWHAPRCRSSRVGFAESIVAGPIEVP